MTHCPHCQQNTIRQVGQSIDCINPECPGYTITLPPERFMNLTAADFASYKAGRDNQVLIQMDVEQAEFEARMAEYEKQQKIRETMRNARVVKEKTFG